MTTKAEKELAQEEKTEKESITATTSKELLEMRISVIKKELVTKDRKVQKDEHGVPLEKHTQHVAFQVTDQVLCEAINDLLGDAVVAQTNVEDHPKDLDGHKFELTGEKPEKKALAA
jgi:hypothetical protein